MKVYINSYIMTNTYFCQSFKHPTIKKNIQENIPIMITKAIQITY